MPASARAAALRTLLAVTVLPAALLVGACGGAERPAEEGAVDTAAAAAAGGAPAGAPAEAIALTEADLDAYERGLQQEIELVRAAQERARTATTPEARGEAMQAQYETATMPAAARAIGVDPERYRRVREAVDEVLRTLDFQGKIEGPMQLDTTRATPEMRATLTRDPFAALPPASATALRARLDRLAPIFARYVTLTAVGG